MYNNTIFNTFVLSCSLPIAHKNSILFSSLFFQYGDKIKVCF